MNTSLPQACSLPVNWYEKIPFPNIAGFVRIFESNDHLPNRSVPTILINDASPCGKYFISVWKIVCRRLLLEKGK